jgi:hypothetical protein
MRKLAFGILFATLATPALAFPARPLVTDHQHALHDVIEVKGGHGHGWGRGHGNGRAFGWSRGKKIGWRGYGCPPGLWKQGRC